MAAALPQMAWRNLWRNRRRTLVTLSSIAFGTMLAVLFTGMGDHNFSDMIDLAARLGGGHVTVQHPEYLDHPKMRYTIPDIVARTLDLRDKLGLQSVSARASSRRSRSRRGRGPRCWCSPRRRRRAGAADLPNASLGRGS